MAPYAYAGRIDVIQAVVVIFVIGAAVFGTLYSDVSGDALIALLSAIVGYVLGTGATLAGANGAAQRIVRVATELSEAANLPPSSPRQ